MLHLQFGYRWIFFVIFLQFAFGSSNDTRTNGFFNYKYTKPEIHHNIECHVSNCFFVQKKANYILYFDPKQKKGHQVCFLQLWHNGNEEKERHQKWLINSRVDRKFHIFIKKGHWSVYDESYDFLRPLQLKSEDQIMI